MPPKATSKRKASRSIPQHIKRAVDARDNFRCQSCGVVTEFIHYDHIFPFDLGGPTTVENMQSLCPKCNTSKGNSIQCHRCRHWMSPENTKCPQCGTKFPYSKHSRTLAGKLEEVFQRVGRVVVIGGAALAAILLLSVGTYIYRRATDDSPTAEQSARVSTIVNSFFDSAPGQPASFQVVVPADAVNARIVGGYKVTSGGAVHCYVLDVGQRKLLAKEGLRSVRFRQSVTPGAYALQFVPAAGPVTVAAEFYLKYD
jgi:5-methylcytosine-specific restriction endonuclease McrA